MAIDQKSGGRAFTLVEVMMSVAIVSMLLVILVSITSSTQHAWSCSMGRIEQFREAREAFESMTQRLSQATLNTYWDYNDPLAPTKYIRQSELRFISGQAADLVGGTSSGHAVFFQAPLGHVDQEQNSQLNNLLNTWGYFVEYGTDQDFIPPCLNGRIHSKNCFRLMQLMEPSESLTLYQYTSGVDSGGKPRNLSYIGRHWFSTPLAQTTPRLVRPIADNVVALVILPKLSPEEDPTGGALAPHYSYDSSSSNANPEINPKNQLPPLLQITFVAADQASFDRLKPGSAAPDFGMDSLFQTTGHLLDSSKPGYARDIDTLTKNLSDHKLNYRVFSTNIAIRGAKWSREQTN